MKEFLKSNTITYNLMSFTGFKAILLFSFLTEGPKSYKELQELMLNHEYLKEKVSEDTLRVYFNSLREIGCNIKKTNCGRVAKYYIDSHPFNLKISDKQVNSIIKVYKAISKSIEAEDLITLQKFFDKISSYITNDELKEKLENVSPLNNISPKMLADLMHYAKNNSEITVLYHSPYAKKDKTMTMIVDRLSINNRKLYIYGYSSEHKNYSSFLVANIKQILSVNILSDKTLEIPNIIVQYEYNRDGNVNLELLSNEKIIKKSKNKYIVEMVSKNKFEIIQRILYLNYNCKVISPDNIRSEVISTLKQMKEGYIGN